MAEKKIYVKDNIRQIVQGANLILSCGAEHSSYTNGPNDHSLHYKWTKDGVAFGDAEEELAYHDIRHPSEFWDRPTIELANILAEDSGIYQCEITNQFGTVLTTPITVEVLDVLNNPLLTRNIVNNGEFRNSDSGWSIIEGSMEQDDPYFWDSEKAKGYASTGNMSPKTHHVMDELEFPPPRPGDRILGPFANRTNTNEVRIQQEIDITSLANVVDRTMEGITEVDFKIAAWIVNKRFHPHYGYYKKLDDNDTDFHYGKGLAPGTEGSSYNTPSQPLQDSRHYVYWHRRAAFFRDKMEIIYTLHNEKGDEIRRMVLKNCPNSYTSNRINLKQRRISLPQGTRKIKIEIKGQRDGNRPWDARHQGQVLKKLQVGCWGIQARIYVNDIGDNWNTNYMSWKMPPPVDLNPAVINYKFGHSEFPQQQVAAWEKDHVNWKGERGVYDGYDYPEAQWLGLPSAGGYRQNGNVINKWKIFDVWHSANDGAVISQPMSHHNLYSKWELTDITNSSGVKYEKHIGTVTAVYDAALGALNVKRMILDWLKDYNLMKLDQFGKSYLLFNFNSILIEKDEQDFNSFINKRRKLILPGSHTTPIIQQKLTVEDFDEAIFEEHIDSSNFRPDLCRTETHQGAWSWEDDEYTYLENNRYWPFRSIMNTGLPQCGYQSLEQFLNWPRYNDELEVWYWSMREYVLYIIGANRENLGLNNMGDVENYISYFRDRMKVDHIYENLKTRSQIPGDIFDNQEQKIKLWIKIRLVQHYLDCAFRSMKSRMTKERKSPNYKEAIAFGPKMKVEEDPSNSWDPNSGGP